jgi:hypothetical protein
VGQAGTLVGEAAAAVVEDGDPRMTVEPLADEAPCDRRTRDARQQKYPRARSPILQEMQLDAVRLDVETALV